MTSGGPTGQSGAIRVAVARALRSFVDIDMVEKMRIGIVLPAKRDSYVMFCLQSYQGRRIDKALVY